MVATVLTVYGIETMVTSISYHYIELQQYLPFTVLKRTIVTIEDILVRIVARVLTVYGIETDHLRLKLDSFLVATVLTV